MHTDENCNFHSNCFTRWCGYITKVQWIHCIPSDSEKCQDLAASKIFKIKTTGCGDIAFCLLGYFILSHPVDIDSLMSRTDTSAVKYSQSVVIDKCEHKPMRDMKRTLHLCVVMFQAILDVFRQAAKVMSPVYITISFTYLPNRTL